MRLRLGRQEKILPEIELPDRVHASIGEEERTFWIKGYKLRNLRLKRGVSLRKFAGKLTEKTGIIIDKNRVLRWERSAWVSLDETEMKGVLAVLKEKVSRF